MSGTGGTVYDATPPGSTCERLNFRTILNSPVPNVVSDVAKLAAMQTVILEIKIESRSNFKVAIACFEDRRVGAITSDALIRLIECTIQGYAYVAEVKSVSGARVEVQVYLK
ncbi:MAG: hypothetical protein WA071_05695 [Undibacterium umbellatum]|uniref:hypothetical protein n=1 Tax=Undibacterium umbellatum TaxID=2762300 RepID=UPI003BB58FF9